VLDVRRRVSELVPEFRENGKQDVVIEQLFTHTAGFPHAPFVPPDFLDTKKRRERFASWRLNWAPGSKFEYHPSSSMYVIADIVERLSGETYGDFVRRRIAVPLGLEDLWVGLPRPLHDRLADCVHVGEALTEEDYRKLGVPVPPVTEVTEDAITSFNRPEVREAGIPGGGGTMTAAELNSRSSTRGCSTAASHSRATRSGSPRRSPRRARSARATCAISCSRSARTARSV